jgi:DNA helicase-2/ATP-dependent DNA helicase PcrA
MLRLANGRAEREHLAAASRAFFRLEGIELSVEDVIASASARGGDYLRSFVEEALVRDSLASNTRALLEGAGVALVETLDYQRFIDSSLEWFGNLDSSSISREERDFADFAIESEIWSNLIAQIKGQYGHEGLSLAAFLQELDLSPKILPIPPGAVRCYTIHNAKGMEFPRVYLIGLAEDVLPSFQAISEGEDSDQMQEERRNCFVGITRTSKQLTMTYAREYFGWEKQPSRFLSEMGAL